MTSKEKKDNALEQGIYRQDDKDRFLASPDKTPLPKKTITLPSGKRVTF